MRTACHLNVVKMLECILVGSKRGSKQSPFLSGWLGCRHECRECREYSPAFVSGPACRYSCSVSCLLAILSGKVLAPESVSSWIAAPGLGVSPPPQLRSQGSQRSRRTWPCSWKRYRAGRKRRRFVPGNGTGYQCPPPDVSSSSLTWSGPWSPLFPAV